ncbi:MAG: HlyC/CorC family transporter [Lachnospiraceae bacterium]|nr:HlyC/CorC family transporter [Lachnospiraceae bacterium]
MDEFPKQGFTEKVRKLLKRKNGKDEEVLAVVDELKQQGMIEEDEAEMISNVMEFSDSLAGDIMTHRTKIIAVSAEEDVDSTLRFMLEENFSRYPIYEETIDNIVGIVYLKDAMIEFLAGNTNKCVSEVAREALYVPETMPVDTLFEELRDKRMHLAVVIDEYGQTAGIVSMEDIIEEIVGEILDEYDEEQDNISVKGEGKFSFTSDAKLVEVSELLNISINEEDLENFETLNGLMISLLGHIPEKNETAKLEYCGFSFEIHSEEGRMIDDIIACKIV